MNLKVYAERHAHALLSELGRMAAQPIATLMMIAVVGIALALPLCFHLLVSNARALGSRWPQGMQSSVYLRTGLSESQARKVAAQIRARPDVAEVALISPDAGLAEFKQRSGFGAALDALQNNPLPFVITVTPALSASSGFELEQTTASLATLPDVDSVQADSQWAKRWFAMIGVLRQVTAAFFALLAAGVLLVIGSTVRLDILNRRDEIEVMKLVGGTNGFVRRPFLYAGALLGLSGAGFAVALVAVVQRSIAGSVAALAQEYGSQYRLAGLDWPTAVILALVAALLGWLGAWLAAQRQIRGIEPT